MPSLPAGPVCCCSASLSCASQHGRICLRLIRRRQDSQGHTSEGSNASAAVVELNFLISSIPLCCQERGPLQSGFSHCAPSFHLIKLRSIMKLWSSSYHRSSRVYLWFEHLFRCSIAHKNYLYSISWKDCLFLLLVHGTINQYIKQCIPMHPFESQYNGVIFSMSKWLLIVQRHSPVIITQAADCDCLCYVKGETVTPYIILVTLLIR